MLIPNRKKNAVEKCKIPGSNTQRRDAAAPCIEGEVKETSREVYHSLASSEEVRVNLRVLVDLHFLSGS
jgi:hypothetical protein